MTKRLKTIVLTSTLILALGLSACSSSVDTTPKEKESTVESSEMESETIADTDFESEESEVESEQTKETSVSEETEKKESESNDGKKETEKKESKKDTTENVASNTDSKKETSANQNTTSKSDNKKETEAKTNSGNKTETKKETESNVANKTDNKKETEPKQNETSAPVHTHTWEKLTETVHHEAQTEKVWVVDQAAWDEPEYEEQTICNVCGSPLYSQDDVLYHQINCHGSYGNTLVPTGKYIHHDEVGHWETKTIKDAYTTQKEVGRKCKTCGAVERY